MGPHHQCCGICPGYVLTPLVQNQIPETAKARGLTEEQVINDVLLHAQPTKKFVTTGEIGGFAVFLCTGAGASITGAVLPVDGDGRPKGGYYGLPRDALGTSSWQAYIKRV